MSNYVYISIETTGLDVNSEKIVEIAALKIDSKTKLRTLFHHYFNPQKQIDASASGIINLTNLFLKECPIISEKIDSLLEFIKGSDLIMRNKPFIMKFLDKELNLVKKILTSNKAIDTQDLARVRFPNEINSLDFLFRALNLEKNITKTCLHEVILLPILVEKIQDHETHEINQMKQFVADKINYIVNCSVINDNGIQLVGTGKSPFILLENSKNEENCIVILKKIKKNFIKNIDNSLPDLLSEYINIVGMDDFKKIKNKINKNYLFEFYLGVINKDFSDFEYENNTNVAIIEGEDDIGNENIIRPYLDKIGSWSLLLNEQKIILNLDNNTIKINNNEIKSNEIFNFLYSSSEQYSAFIID